MIIACFSSRRKKRKLQRGHRVIKAFRVDAIFAAEQELFFLRLEQYTNTLLRQVSNHLLRTQKLFYPDMESVKFIGHLEALAL